MSVNRISTLQIPRTSLRVTVDESLDAGAWEPLDRCAGEPYGVYRSICLYLSDTETATIAKSYVDAVLTDGDDEIGYQADPDRGDWDGDAAIVAAASAHSRAIYWTCFELLNRLGAELEPSARAAIEQQKKGA
jgi:hypothetical protein